MNSSLWMDATKFVVVPLPDGMAADFCPNCKHQRPVIRKLKDIICGECRVVLYSR